MSACSKARARPRALKRLRTLSALAVSLVVLGITAAGFLAERGVTIPGFIPTCLHGVCPFGGVATIGRLLSGGLFVPRTGAANLFALAASLGATLFMGAFFCGWLCPLGVVQEWVRRLGRRIGICPKSAGFPFTAPGALAVDRALGYLRYGTLAVILYGTYRSFNLVFSAVDPFYALFHFWTGAALPAALAVLAATLLLSLVVHRPWCRWLCPFGAVQGLVQKLAPWKIRRDAQACVDCGACDRACPLNISISAKSVVTDSRCNRCLSCLAACPKTDALRLASPFGLRPASRAAAGPPACPGQRTSRRPARSLLSQARGLAAVVLVAFLLPLAAGTAYRLLSTRAELGAAASGAVSGLAADRTAAAAAPAGEPEAVMQTLSSSLSLGQAAELLSVEQQVLLEALELPAGFDLSVKLRDLEEFEEQKTYRWVRERIQTLLQGGGFTQASPHLRETCTPGVYPVIRNQLSGGLT